MISNLTGLEMIASTASGANLPQPSTSVLTMPAFVLKRSSRVMPGLRGTPAGITTTSAPRSAASRPVSWVAGQVPADGRCPVILAPVGQCDRSVQAEGGGGRGTRHREAPRHAVRTSRDTRQDWCHVVARHFVDVLGELAQQRERLTDATTCAEHGYLGRLELQAHARRSRASERARQHESGDLRDKTSLW